MKKVAAARFNALWDTFWTMVDASLDDLFAFGRPACRKRTKGKQEGPQHCANVSNTSFGPLPLCGAVSDRQEAVTSGRWWWWWWGGGRVCTSRIGVVTEVDKPTSALREQRAVCRHGSWLTLHPSHFLASCQTFSTVDRHGDTQEGQLPLGQRYGSSPNTAVVIVNMIANVSEHPGL